MGRLCCGRPIGVINSGLSNPPGGFIPRGLPPGEFNLRRLFDDPLLAAGFFIIPAKAAGPQRFGARPGRTSMDRTMSKVSLKTLGFILTAFFLWGNAFIAIGYLLESLGPYELLLLRFLPVTAYCLFMGLTSYRKEFWYLLRHHLGRTTLCGLVMVLGYHLSLNLGQGYVTPQAASLLVTSAPLLTLLLAATFLGETLTGRRVMGAVVAFGGMALVVLLGKVGDSPDLFIPLDKLPYALALLACSASTAVYMVLAKSLSREVSPAALNYTTMGLGSLPLLFFWTPELAAKALGLGWHQLAALAFLSIGCTIVAYVLFLHGVKNWQASNTSLFIFLNAPFTILFSYLFFGQGITTWFAAGGAIMLGGIYLAVSHQPAKDKAGALTS